MVFDCLRFHNNHFTYINYTIKSSNDTGRRICSTNCIKRNIFCSLSHIFWTSSYNLCFVWMEIMFVTSSHRHQRLPKQQTKETPTRVHIYSTITWHTHKFSQPLFTLTSTVVTESFTVHSTDLKLSEEVLVRLSQMWSGYDFYDIWSRLGLVSEHQQHLWLSHPPHFVLLPHTQRSRTVFFSFVSHSGKKSDKEIWSTVREHFYK